MGDLIKNYNTGWRGYLLLPADALNRKRKRAALHPLHQFCILMKWMLHLAQGKEDAMGIQISTIEPLSFPLKRSS